MYRTKILSMLVDEFLNPILEFNGLIVDKNSGCGLIRFADCDAKGEPVYLENKSNENRNLAFILTENEYAQYKNKRDTAEYFNPFIKFKNALTLLLMATPSIYLKFCKDSEIEDSDFINELINEEPNVSQEEILKYISIKQYPVRFDPTVEEIVYTYELVVKSDSGNICSFKSGSPNKCVAIIMMLIKMIAEMDIDPPIVESYAGDYARIEERLKDLLEKYEKERSFNRRDILKDSKTSKEDMVDYSRSTDDKTVEDLDEILYSPTVEEISKEDIIEDIDNSARGEDISSMISEIMICPKESDDEFEGLTFS